MAFQKISDRVADVALELGNRADITSGAPSRVAKWLKNSYLNLGMGISFAELEQSISTQLVQGTPTYPYPLTARALRGITVYRPDGTAIPVDIKDIVTFRKYNNSATVGQGPPSIAALFGTQIFLSPIPDGNGPYNMVLDFWQKPIISSNTVDTQLQVPDDWLEIVDYGAILRGHSALLERDKAKQIQELLFGFTMPTSGKLVPGLIATMMNRRQAEAPAMDYGLAPSAARRSYTSQG